MLQCMLGALTSLKMKLFVLTALLGQHPGNTVDLECFGMTLPFLVSVIEMALWIRLFTSIFLQ